MTTPLPVHIEMTPGLPAPGAPGQYLGTDATGAMWLLRWSSKYAEWQALGFERDLGPSFPVLRRGADLATLIIGHVRGPDPTPEAKPCRSA
jgi:hypothetical protein